MLIVILIAVIVMPLAGLLCKYGFAGGWPSIFYVLGGAGVVWTALWMRVAADSPKTHNRIHETERKYIVESISAFAPADNTKVATTQLTIHITD